MTEKISSRERVLKTLNHEKPDRIPVDLGSFMDASIVKEAYNNLRSYLGLSTSEPKLLSNMLRSVKIENDVFNYLEPDVCGIFPGSPGEDTVINDNKYKDGWGITRVMPKGSFYYDQVKFPLSGEITTNDIKNYNWPDPEDSQITKGLTEKVQKLKNNTDCALVINLPAPFIHRTQFLRGFEDWFIDCVNNVDLLEILFDKVLEINMRIAKKVLEKVGEYGDIVMFGDDLGTQNGLQVSPEFFRKSIKPRVAKYIKLINENAEVKVLFHSCGSISEILDDLIEVGVEIINPVQVTAAGMKPDILKERFGDKLSFWGGIDTQDVLCNGSTADVKREVEYMINKLGIGGGYVLGAVHNIQPGVPPENIVTMFNYAKEYSSQFYNK